MSHQVLHFLSYYQNDIRRSLETRLGKELFLLEAGHSNLKFIDSVADPEFIIKVRPGSNELFGRRAQRNIPDKGLPVVFFEIIVDSQSFIAESYSYIPGTPAGSIETVFQPEEILNWWEKSNTPETPAVPASCFLFAESLLAYIDLNIDRLSGHTLGPEVQQQWTNFQAKGRQVLQQLNILFHNRPEVIIHGDSLPDNLIVNGPVLTWIDWEDAHTGPPEVFSFQFLANFYKAGRYTRPDFSLQTNDFDNLLKAFALQYPKLNFVYIHREILKEYYYFYQCLLYLERAVEYRWELVSGIGFDNLFHQFIH